MKINPVITGSVIGAGLVLLVSRAAGAAEPEELNSGEVLITHFELYPEEINPGQTVTVRVTVENTVDHAGYYTVTLGGDFFMEKTVTLAPGQSKVVTFQITGGAAGSYQVSSEGHYGSFEVVETAQPQTDIRVTNLEVAPQEVAPGETVYIQITATNYGDAYGSKVIICEVT
jgi:uncharacterized protein YfaS (alpha-2-macroglobulin family)